MDGKGTPRSITLPETIKVFRNLKNAKRFAIDIGKILLNISKIYLYSYYFDFMPGKLHYYVIKLVHFDLAH